LLQYVGLSFSYGVFGNEILQDEGLDAIGEGLETLKNMASDMNEVACCALFLVI